MSKRKNVTMADVAKRANVSQPTVSMILSGRHASSFPSSTAERVLTAARELGYLSGRGDGIPRSRQILVLAVTVTNPYYSTMVHSIERLIQDTEFRILVCDTYHIPEVETAYLDFAVQAKYAGVIFLYPPDNPEAFHAVSHNLPVIAICDRTSNMKPDIVELDNRLSGALAAEHLLSLGHRKLAFLSNSPAGNTGRSMRLEGIQSKMRKHGLDGNLLLCIKDDNSADSIQYADYAYRTGRQLALDERIYSSGVTGLICVDDMLAFGAMDALLERGYRIPRDFSIIGFDNLLYSGFSRISLTTIDHRMSLVSQSAAELLLHRIRNPLCEAGSESGLARFKFECAPTLVVRGSTASPIRP